MWSMKHFWTLGVEGLGFRVYSSQRQPWIICVLHKEWKTNNISMVNFKYFYWSIGCHLHRSEGSYVLLN
jgi:hypothetical protein